MSPAFSRSAVSVLRVSTEEPVSTLTCIHLTLFQNIPKAFNYLNYNSQPAVTLSDQIISESLQ